MNNFVEELSVVGIYDSGVANLERVVLRSNIHVDLAGYLLVVALRGQLGGGAIPLTDNAMWLGNYTLSPGDWAYVYTGPGQAQTNPLPNNPNKVVCLYWGKIQTMFQATHLTAALVKVDRVQYPAFSSQFLLGQQQPGYPSLDHSSPAPRQA